MLLRSLLYQRSKTIASFGKIYNTRTPFRRLGPVLSNKQSIYVVGYAFIGVALAAKDGHAGYLEDGFVQIIHILLLPSILFAVSMVAEYWVAAIPPQVRVVRYSRWAEAKRIPGLHRILARFERLGTMREDAWRMSQTSKVDTMYHYIVSFFRSNVPFTRYPSVGMTRLS